MVYNIKKIMTYLPNSVFTVGDGINIDAFGRLRTSGTGQRFDAEFIYDKQPLLFTEQGSGSGSILHNAASRDVSLKVTDSVNGSYRSLALNYHVPYTPGNGQLIDITGTLNGANISGGTCEIFHKNGIISGETTYPQSGWTELTTGLNWQYSQIFQIDFQSLKIGRIRFNLVKDGLPINVLNIENDNRRKHGYWQYPALPPQYRIYNTATETITEIGYFWDSNGIGFRYRVPITNLQELVAVCVTVKSEGGYNLFDIPGYPFSADIGETSKTVSDTLVPLITIRPKTTFNGFTNNTLIIPQGFTVQTNNPIRYVVLLNATINATNWTDLDASSACEFNTDATTVSGGVKVDSDYVATGSRNTTQKDEGILGRILLSLKPNGVASTLTIAAIRTTGTNASVYVVIKEKEIR